MRINSSQNYCLNKSTPNFRGFVSPKYYEYINGMRNKWLKSATEDIPEDINFKCDNILSRSSEIMKKYFPPSAVLSVNTAIDENSDRIVIEDGILKKYGHYLTQLFSVPRQTESLYYKIELLGKKIESLNLFGFLDNEWIEIGKICDKVTKCKDYKVYNRIFFDLEYILNWWKEHMDTILKGGDYPSFHKKACTELMSQLTEHRQKLMQKYPRRRIEAEDKPVIDWLRADLEQTMPDARLYSGRKSDDEMQKFLDELLPPVLRARYRNSLGVNDIGNLSRYKIIKIRGTENCFRGPIGYSDLDILKPLGLKVINIRPMVGGDFFVNHIDEIVDYIKSMQHGSVYFGCSFGINETNIAETLDYYLNPLQKHAKQGLFCTADYNDLLDLCDMLTPEQKREMQWTEEFEKELRAKLEKDKID